MLTQELYPGLVVFYAGFILCQVSEFNFYILWRLFSSFPSLGPIVGGLVNKFGCRPVCMAGREFQVLRDYLSSIFFISFRKSHHLHSLQSVHFRNQCPNVDVNLRGPWWFWPRSHLPPCSSSCWLLF